MNLNKLNCEIDLITLDYNCQDNFNLFVFLMMKEDEASLLNMATERKVMSTLPVASLCEFGNSFRHSFSILYTLYLIVFYIFAILTSTFEAFLC